MLAWMQQEKLGHLAGLSRRGREETAGVEEEVSWHTTWDQEVLGWFLLVMQEPPEIRRFLHGTKNMIKNQPLQGERAPGEASQNPHTHQLDCQVQAKALTTEVEMVICYIRLLHKS